MRPHRVEGFRLFCLRRGFRCLCFRLQTLERGQYALFVPGIERFRPAAQFSFSLWGKPFESQLDHNAECDQLTTTFFTLLS